MTPMGAHATGAQERGIVTLTAIRDERLGLDEDAVPALRAERATLWAQLEAASFIGRDEKRAAVGYGPEETP